MPTSANSYTTLVTLIPSAAAIAPLLAEDLDDALASAQALEDPTRVDFAALCSEIGIVLASE